MNYYRAINGKGKWFIFPAEDSYNARHILINTVDQSENWTYYPAREKEYFEFIKNRKLEDYKL